MIFWSDATDRESPVPSEAINISHLPTRSGRGSGGTGEASALSPGQSVQKPSGDSPSVGLRGWAGRAGAENNSFCCGWGWGGGGWRIIGQNKESARTKSLHLDRTESQRLLFSGCPALAPPPGSHTPPPHGEGGMEGGVGSSTRGHAPVPPPGPQVHTLPAGALFPMPTLLTPSRHPHTLSGAPQGAQAGTHTHIPAFM